MRWLKVVLLMPIFLGALAFESAASHVAGADISYICLGNDSFIIRVKIWRDCSGIDLGMTTLTVTATNSCGLPPQNVTLNVVPPPPGNGLGGQGNGFNVSQLCPADSCCSACMNNAACAPACTGNYPGMLEYVFEGIAVLPPCNFWTIGYAVPCCRNTLVNTNNTTTYVETILNNDPSVGGNCNSSPEFTTPNPISYVCLNAPVCYDFGVVETDGDSLVYSIVDGFDGNNTTPVVYQPPYSSGQPITGVTINPISGTVNFTPTALGNFLFVVKVDEYRNGVLISSVMREMQFVVIACSNNPPNLCGSQAAITNFQGQGALLDSSTVEVCYGQFFSFDIVITDPDPNTFLQASSNVDQVLPGASIVVVGTNPITVTISWTATLGANPFNSFYLAVNDNTCPLPAISTATYNVRVIPSTYAGPDQTICRGVEQAQLNAIGGTQFIWSVLAGSPISIGTNFTCNNCPNPIATPQQTTTYVVTSDLSSSCKNIDTVTVYVADNYTLATRADTIICFNDSTVQISTLPSISATFSYQWDNGQLLDFDTIQSPFATPIESATFNVTVTSDSGCVKTATTRVRVTPPFPKDINAIGDDTVSCAGIPLQLGLQLGKVINSCTLANDVCEGTLEERAVGAGFQTNTATGAGAWPTPYGNSQRSARMQYMIRASELNAAGIFKGSLEGLAFFVQSNTGGLANYDNFSIKLKCTNDSVLNTWQSGMHTVYNPKLTAVAAGGWSYHEFDSHYDYDGISNLVVEVCFFRPLFPSQNAQTRYTPTSYTSVIYNFSFTGNMCASNAIAATSVNRPNIRFTYCPGPNPSAFVALWTPGTYLSDSTVLNPIASIADAISYTVYIQDTSGSCFDTSSINLQLSTIEISPDTAVCPNTTIQLFASGNSTCTGQQPNYSWLPAAKLNNPNIANPIAFVDTATMFYVTFSDPCGCTITDSVYVDVKSLPEPQILFTPPSCGLANGAISFIPTGGTAPYQYSLDSGLTYSSNPQFTGLDNGIFDVLMRDQDGCYFSVRDTFKNPAPLIDTIISANLSCFESGDGLVAIHAYAGLSPYLYSVDNGLNYQTDSAFQTLGAGSYQIRVMSADSCETTPVRLTLNEPTRLVLDFEIDSISCFQACDGALSIQPLGGTAPYSFNFDSLGTDSAYSSLCGGNYAIELLDANQCVFDTVIHILEPDGIVINSIDVNPITCNGYSNGKITINASGGTNGLFYSIDGGANYFVSAIFDSLSPAVYDVAVSDANGCEFIQTFTITEPPAMVLQTNFDTTTICVSACQEVFAITNGGNSIQYRYFWTGGLADTNYQLICPTQTRNVAVYALDSLGCISNTKFLQINLFDSLDLKVSPNDTICSSFSTPLNAKAKGGDGLGYNYHWSPYPGLNHPLISNPIASPDSTITYTVTVTDNCGSPAITKSLTITVNPMPVIDVLTDKVSGCEPLAIRFTNSGTQNATCLWDFGDSPRLFQSCNSIVYNYRKWGEYDVKFKIETNEGCSDSILLPNFIEVYKSPVADFYMEPEQASAFNPEVTFTNASEGDIVGYFWQFGTIGSSFSRDTAFTFPVQDTATYPIKLTVTNYDGCVDDTIKYIFVDTEYYLFVPTAFTPNGDGVNDIFTPVSNGVEPDNYLFTVTDRWGKTIFSTQNINQGWNGGLNNTGDLLPAGVYVWRIQLGEFAGEEDSSEVRVGQVTLIR